MICDEVGAAWRDLGAELRLGSPVVRNFALDCKSHRDRAWEVIDKWRQSNPNEATVGNLADALVKIRMEKPPKSWLVRNLLFSWELTQGQVQLFPRNKVPFLDIRIKNDGYNFC